MNLQSLGEWLAPLCFGYPFVMAFYWMVGGLLFHLVRERNEPAQHQPPELKEYPPVSVLVPCFNEELQAEETFGILARLRYPDYEIIAINDGSSDGTAPLLDDLARRIPHMRVVHLQANQGKSVALNIGAVAARHEFLVCIDGDTLLDPLALTWFVRRFLANPILGALAGSPRVRNRATLLGRLQVGEFSNIVGLIKRAQNIYGTLFTVSGAVCAFRKRALHDAGWWNPNAITDDVDVSWRVQLAGWHIGFEPKAMGWILTPETLRGLWRQRLRWSEGGTSVVLRATPHLFQRHTLRLWPTWLNFIAALAWAYAMLAMSALWILRLLGLVPESGLDGISVLPGHWGLALALTYLLQAVVSESLDRRLEPGYTRTMFWVVWYPFAFWIMQAAAAVVGLPKALLRRRDAAGTWVSPDRGFR